MPVRTESEIRFSNAWTLLIQALLFPRKQEALIACRELERRRVVFDQQRNWPHSEEIVFAPQTSLYH